MKSARNINWLSWGRIAILAASLILIAGCSQMDAPTAPSASENSLNTISDIGSAGDNGAETQGRPNFAEGWIDSEGGRLRLGCNLLEVPAGAVNGMTHFSMTLVNGEVGVDCGPEGLTFNSPVRLTVCYAGTHFDGGQMDENLLRVLYVPANGSPVPQPSIVDVHGKKVIAEIHHFSRYIIG